MDTTVNSRVRSYWESLYFAHLACGLFAFTQETGWYYRLPREHGSARIDSATLGLPAYSDFDKFVAYLRLEGYAVPMVTMLEVDEDTGELVIDVRTPQKPNGTPLYAPQYHSLPPLYLKLLRQAGRMRRKRR